MQKFCTGGDAELKFKVQSLKLVELIEKGRNVAFRRIMSDGVSDHGTGKSPDIGCRGGWKACPTSKRHVGFRRIMSLAPGRYLKSKIMQLTCHP